MKENRAGGKFQQIIFKHAQLYYNSGVTKGGDSSDKLFLRRPKLRSLPTPDTQEKLSAGTSNQHIF